MSDQSLFCEHSSPPHMWWLIVVPASGSWQNYIYAPCGEDCAGEPLEPGAEGLEEQPEDQ